MFYIYFKDDEAECCDGMELLGTLKIDLPDRGLDRKLVLHCYHLVKWDLRLLREMKQTSEIILLILKLTRKLFEGLNYYFIWRLLAFYYFKSTYFKESEDIFLYLCNIYK